MLLAVLGTLPTASAQPAESAFVQPGFSSQCDSGNLGLLHVVLVLLVPFAVWWWHAALSARTELRAFKEGLAAGQQGTACNGTRWCSCGALLGSVPLANPFGAFRAEAQVFVPDAAIPWGERPRLPPGPPAFAAVSCIVAALMVLLLWAAEGFVGLVCFVLSPSTVKMKRPVGSRYRACAISRARRPAGLDCGFGPLRPCPIPMVRRPQAVGGSVRPPAASPLQVAPDVDFLGLPIAPPPGLPWPHPHAQPSPPPLPPPTTPLPLPSSPPLAYVPTLTAGEHARLVRHGRIPHPVSWGDTAADQVRFAGLAHEARLLRPHTLGEEAIRSNPHLTRERDRVDQWQWPVFDVQVGDTVQLHGLTTRADLEGTAAMVVGLERHTRRVGVRIADGSVIYVVQERITMLDYAVDGVPTDGVGALALAASDCGVIPTAQRVFRTLQAAVLSYLEQQDDDGLGVSFDAIVAHMSSSAPRATGSDIRFVVDRLFREGDCYSTVDAHHFLAV